MIVTSQRLDIEMVGWSYDCTIYQDITSIICMNYMQP